MAQVKTLTDMITGERYFRASGTGMSFRRISAALAWPAEDKPGSLIVLGETRSKQNAHDIGRHDVHVLAEYRNGDVSMLLDYMARMTDDWMVTLWATPISDKRVYMLDDLAEAMRKIRRRPARYSDPQGWEGKGEGLIPFYAALVQRRTMSEKTLFFGGPCDAAVEICKLQPEDMNRKPTDFPAAAALFFALAEIDVDPWPEWGERAKLYGGPADELGGY